MSTPIEERVRAAQLVREMVGHFPWNEKPWARMALAAAERTILRGRHLTNAERLENLAKSLEDEPGDTEEERAESRDIAQRIRSAIPHSPN